VNRPASVRDAEDPLNGALLEQLEESFDAANLDHSGGLTLRDHILKDLEEWEPEDLLTPPEAPIPPEPGTEARTSPLIPPADREHPLWDKELDG
jgi:hypothetical protein